MDRDPSDLAEPLGHHVFKVPRDRLVPFFEQVPDLFTSTQSKVTDLYQACLYRTEHDFDASDLARIDAAWDIRPQWGASDVRQVIRTLDSMRYPDTRPLGTVTAVSGLDLRGITHYLHFFHHTYPIFDKASLAGLAKLGMDVPWTKVRDPDIYGLYIAAIDELKDRIPFWWVPETNVHLTRIIQAALAAW